MSSAMDIYKQPPGTNPKTNQPILGQDNIVYKNISAHQSRITTSLFVPVKTSRIKTKGMQNQQQYDDQESENNKLTLHDQIRMMNKIPDGVWSPSLDESMSSLAFNRKSPELAKQQSMISGESPGLGSRITPNYQLRLKMTQPQVSPGFHINRTQVPEVEENIAAPNFNESIRSSTQWLKDATNIDIKNYNESLNNTTQLNWKSKLPLINIQIDPSKSTINYQGQVQQSINNSIKDANHLGARLSQISGSPDYIGVNDLTVQVTIQGKMFPKRFVGNTRKYIVQNDRQSSHMQNRGGMIELRSPFTPPDAVRNHPKPKPTQIRILSRQRDQKEIGCGTANSTQYGPGGFKNMLQGGYQHENSKASDDKNSKTAISKDGSTTPKSMNTKQIPPARNHVNNTVLDAKHLGFLLPNNIDDLKQAFSPSVIQTSGKQQAGKKNFRKKQLQAYHGWLKSKAIKAQSVMTNPSRINDYNSPKPNEIIVQNEDPLLMESPDEKQAKDFLSPQPHGPPKLLEDYSIVKTTLFPPPGPNSHYNKIQKFLSPKVTNQGLSKQTQQTQIVIPMIPDLSRFLNNESLATIDRDLLNQHQTFLNSPHFENSHRSLKGLFRKTSKPTPFGGSSQISPRQLKNLTPHLQSSFDHDEMRIPKEKIAQSQLQKYVAVDGKIGLKELRRLSQNIQRASEFIYQSQDDNVQGAIAPPIMLPNRPAFSIGVTSQVAHSPYERNSKNHFKAGGGLLLRDAAVSVMSHNSGIPIQIPCLPNLNGSHTVLQVTNLQQQQQSPEPILNRTMYNENNNSPSQDEKIAMVSRIRDQQHKKRRGKFNKNEALYEFIEQIHLQQLVEQSLPSQESPRYQLNGSFRGIAQRNQPLDYAIANIRGTPTRLLQLINSQQQQQQSQTQA